MKKILFLLLICLSISLLQESFGYSQNDIESFYYTKTLPTIDRYVDDHHTSLGVLYEYKDFLDEKIKNEIDRKKLQTLFILEGLNNENIQKQLYNLQTSKSNTEIFIKYFENKHPEYQKFIDIIKNTGFINSKDENGNTFLGPLLKNGTYEDIDFALNRGLNPNNIENNNSLTFLNFLKSGGKFFPPTYLDKLLAGKVDMDGTQAVFYLILKKGYNINLTDGNNENIAFALLDIKNKNLFSHILEKNDFDFAQKNNSGENLLLYAIKKGLDNSFIFPLIQNEKIDINATDNNWESPLFFLTHKEKEYFYELFKRNIKINQQNKLGQTELIKLIQNETDEKTILEKYRLLASYKPLDLSLADEEKNTALFIAIQKNYLEIVKELLLLTPDFKTKNKDGKNILSVATSVSPPSPEMIQEILSYPIDINSQDEAGNTALHHLLQHINYEIVGALLKNKTNLNILNNEKENILTYIIEKNDIGLLNQVIEYGIDINQIISEDKNNIFLKIVQEEKIDILKIILKNKILLQLNINFTDGEQHNALFYAIKNKDFGMVELLIEHGININQANTQGLTPLMVAGEIGNTNILRSLGIRSDLDVRMQDINGENALLYACKKGNENIIRMLLALKTPQIKNKDGKGCFDFILESNIISKDIFQYLQ